MSETGLNIQPLQKAIARLREGLQRHTADQEDDQLRDGLIQRFEFTYEITHKMLKRFLEATSATPAEFDLMSFQDLIRTGNERGLLKGDWSKWKQYREMRAKTSHTYAEDIALDLVQQIPEFLEEAAYLAQRLQEELT